MFHWGGYYALQQNGELKANFKPRRGNYIEDGSLTTCEVATGEANDFGLYDMAGNVAHGPALHLTNRPTCTSMISIPIYNTIPGRMMPCLKAQGHTRWFVERYRLLPAGFHQELRLPGYCPIEHRLQVCKVGAVQQVKEVAQAGLPPRTLKSLKTLSSFMRALHRVC